ncbi:MAG: T9SS type A sorting domain-containing protein [Dysgonamonadaceae bacterium]|jgi:hypothetical protein|nr:T9SS type A sorting domain-containing protein [Dysgonamonadaceae bacterium]
MKNITIFLLSMVLAFTANAQPLATFEDGANDLAAFGTNDTGGGGFWFDTARFIDGGAPQVGNNPAKGGLNTSEKCLLAVNVADADWWGNFCSIGLATPITITEQNRYLHFMAYRSIQPKEFRVNVNGNADGGNAGGSQIWNGKLKQNATWEWVVVDLGSKILGQELSVISFVLSNNWDDPRTGWDVATYAFDNFELSGSSLPPDVTLIDGSALKIGYESQSEIDQWVQEFDLLNTNNTASIIDNPFTTSEVNSGGKILQFNKSDQASWWQGYRINFKGIMAVGDPNPNYLHVLVYVPSSILEGDMISMDVQLCAKDHLGNENAELFTVWDDEMDEWVDLVMDINKIEYLKEVTVRYDLRKDAEDNYINSPTNTFYLDEIVFNKDDERRTYIETGVRETLPTPFATVTTTDDAINVRSAKQVNIQLYNVLGGLVRSVNVNGTASIPVDGGVYIVKINSVNGEQQIAKVLVK